MASQKGFYYNQNYCVGCQACQIACKVANEVAIGVVLRKIDSFEIEKKGRMVERQLSHSCMHCAEPECARVCPVSAYTKREVDGLVIQDNSKCIGCKYCMNACPYQAPQWNAGTGKVEKCNGCYELIDNGEEPACVRGCPVQCLNFDELEKLDANGAVKEAVGFEAYNTKPSIRFVPQK